MPNGHSDADPVSYGRWQAEHDRLRDQIRDLDQRLQQEITALRGDFAEFTSRASTALTRRRDRQWTIALAFVTGLALPLAVTALIALTGLH